MSGVAGYENKPDSKTDILEFYLDIENRNNVVVGSLLSKGIRNVVVPSSYDGKKVTEINPKAFFQINNLERVELPDTIIDIWDSAFEGCNLLSEIIIPNEKCIIHKYAFRECKSLAKISLPDNMDYIWDSTFDSCASLREISLPSKLKVISQFAFMNCYNLGKIVLPQGTTEIKEYAFSGCDNLLSILIPDSVTYIGEGAFDGCSALNIYGMPNSYAYKYAISHKIPFLYLNSLVIGDRILKSGEIARDISGEGWEWIASLHLLRLMNYSGGSINRYGADLKIELMSGTSNSISGAKGNESLYGLSSHGYSVFIDGDGELMIESFKEGIYATKSVYINSGTITSIGVNHGVIARNDDVVITGGTIHANASGDSDSCYAIYGKLQTSNARIFVSINDWMEPVKALAYMHQKYACITFDENCNLGSAKTVFSGCTFGDNAQVVTGNVNGNVIGSDNIINRSDLSVKSTDENNNVYFCPLCGAKIDDLSALFCYNCGGKIRGQL